jgi:hypothetical protein
MAKKKQTRKARSKSAPDYRHASASLVAEVCGVSTQAVDKWRKAGAPCKKQGKRYTYDLPALIAWRIDREAGVARLGHSAAELDNDYMVEHLRNIIENERSGVARVKAIEKLEQLRDRMDAEAQMEDGAGVLVSFVEIENREDALGPTAIGLTGREAVGCPRCGELVEVSDAD